MEEPGQEEEKMSCHSILAPIEEATWDVAGSQCCWAFSGYPEMSYMMDSSIDTGLC